MDDFFNHQNNQINNISLQNMGSHVTPLIEDDDHHDTIFESHNSHSHTLSFYDTTSNFFLVQDQDTTSTDTENVVDAGAGGGGAGAGKPTATPAQFADYMINGFWSDFGGSARSWTQDNITYSISNAYSAAQKDGIRMAFEQWQDVADLTFTEVGSGGNMDIRVGPVNDGAYSSSSTAGGNIISNFISIDTSKSYWQNFNDIGDYALITAIHEIGHSLGLGHTGNYNGSANYATDAVWANDTRQYSVMSYFDADNSGADHSDLAGWQYGSTPALYDILAIQTIYGANNTIRSGNTTYGFNATAGRDQFDFTITDDPVVTIWDSGGTDTLDLSGYSVTQTIRLDAGSFSDIGGMTGNLSIAFNTIIENVIGGSNADSIYGNSADNVILGGNGDDILFASAGDDTLDGQTGNDTANYNFSVTAFAFNFIDSVTVAINHLAQLWSDTVTNIENFIFTDGNYTFNDLQNAFNVNNFAPVVTANNLTLTQTEEVLASSVLSATDADANTLSYEVWDGNKKYSSGYFDLNGSKLSAKTGHVLTQDEFNDLKIVGGLANGSDDLWVRASDGVHTTSWESFTLTTNGAPVITNTTPTVTANNLTLSTGASILASSTITANDGDGDILTYDVWDSGASQYSGYFDLNGQKLNAGIAHHLTQDEFDDLLIIGGSIAGNDTLWVKVFDGTINTAWQEFTLSTIYSTPNNGGGGGGNNAPTVTANALSLTVGDSVLASSVITANDIDGDPLSYDVWDGGKASFSGYFELNGQRLAADTSHHLTQAEFDSLLIVGASFASRETLWVKVSDGTDSTAWTEFTFTTVPPAGMNIDDILDMNEDNIGMALAEQEISPPATIPDTVSHEQNVFTAIEGFNLPQNELEHMI